MDTSNFLKQIRAIIREEIEYALNKQLTEMVKLTKTSTKQLTETSRKPLKITPIVSTKQTDKPSVKHKPTSLKSKLNSSGTKLEDTALQTILAETRRSMEAAMAAGEPIDLGAGDEYQEMRYSTNDVPYIGSKYIADMEGEIDPSIPIAPSVQKALTRNYSDLVAAMNSKK